MALLYLASCAPGGIGETACVPSGAWVEPKERHVLAAAPLFAGLAESPVVLLGESHDNAAHHRWQADTIARLYTLHPNIVIGIEMLPRRSQNALDRYVAGTTSEAEFLVESDWERNWGIDFALYRPVFEFARSRRLKMTALNVDRTLVRKVSRNGFDAVAPGEREGVGRAAAPSAAYRERLTAVYREHQRAGDPAALEHFIEAQLLWDRAMAEALHAAEGSRGPLVIGLVGAAHAAQFDGVPHQLAALGTDRARVLLPWDADRPCSELTPDLADAVFGLPREGNQSAQTKRPGRAGPVTQSF